MVEKILMIILIYQKQLDGLHQCIQYVYIKKMIYLNLLLKIKKIYLFLLLKKQPKKIKTSLNYKYSDVHCIRKFRLAFFLF